MDPRPHFDPETSSVCFYVHVRGARIKSFVTRDWLVKRFGPGIPADGGMVDAYLANAQAIDNEIARRVAAGRIEPVWLACSLPPLA
jgi:hypothetical protein